MTMYKRLDYKYLVKSSLFVAPVMASNTAGHQSTGSFALYRAPGSEECVSGGTLRRHSVFLGRRPRCLQWQMAGTSFGLLERVVCINDEGFPENLRLWESYVEPP